VKGWIIAQSSIFEKELRWVDAHDDIVTDGGGRNHGRGTWALLLDTAKDIAIKQAEAGLAKAKLAGNADIVDYWRTRLREMRGEGKFNIYFRDREER
jgi:hypothetical protein